MSSRRTARRKAAAEATPDRVTAFATAVVDGTEPAGELFRAACARHLRDLERAAAGGPYVFDVRIAEMTARFFAALPHYKGEWAGRPITLEPFQHFIIGSLFGWVHRETRLRRFRQAYLEQPRGQGKSTIAAGVGLKLAFFDHEPGAEVYCAATMRSQARITWDAAREMVLRSPLKRRIKALVGNLHELGTASKMVPLGADADTLDGLRPNGVILDEIHAMRTSAMIDVLSTATGPRRQPLLFEITTAGVGQIGICWAHHDYTSKVVRGVVEDETWFGAIIAADPEDDWRDPAVWRKANPNLGVSVKADDLARKCTQAVHIPSFEPEFRRLHLGQWVQQAEKYLSMLAWDAEANAAPIDRAALRKMPCVLGLDVSSKFDITAVVAVFARPDGGVLVLPTFFAPEAIVDQTRRAMVPLAAWQRQGFLRTTPGDVIDQAAIEQTILALADEFRVREVAFDAWNATQIAVNLQAHGLEVVEVRQGFKSLSEPTKELAALVASGKLQHAAHPVLRWMADNLVVREDVNGNVAPDKRNAAEKIDGMVALIMALSRRGSLKARAEGPRERGILIL
jgi:phage terminase large subunit-like protein